MRIKIQPYHTSLNTKKLALKTLLSATLLGDAILPYHTDWTELKQRQNTSLTGWVNWMQKWNRSIFTSDRSDFYRTNVFILKHSHCSKQLTSLCLNSKSQICQNWKWIHFILHSIDSAREASEEESNTLKDMISWFADIQIEIYNSETWIKILSPT